MGRFELLLLVLHGCGLASLAGAKGSGGGGAGAGGGGAGAGGSSAVAAAHGGSSRTTRTSRSGGVTTFTVSTYTRRYFSAINGFDHECGSCEIWSYASEDLPELLPAQAVWLEFNVTFGNDSCPVDYTAAVRRPPRAYYTFNFRSALSSLADSEQIAGPSRLWHSRGISRRTSLTRSGAGQFILCVFSHTCW